MKTKTGSSFLRRTARTAMALVLLLVTSASALAGSWSDTFYATDVSYAFQEWSYTPKLKGGTWLTAHRGQYDSPDGGPTKMYISRGGSSDFPLVAEVLEGYGITSVVLQTAPTYAGTPKEVKGKNGAPYWHVESYTEYSGTTPGSTITVYFTNVTNRVEIHLWVSDGLELTSVTVNYSSPLYTISYIDDVGSTINHQYDQVKAHDAAVRLRGEYLHWWRDGYTHEGWAWGPRPSPKAYDLDGTFTYNTDATLFAYWEPIIYNITYDLDGGTLDADNPTTYNIETPTITLNNPTREGNAFMGWEQLNDIISGGRVIEYGGRPPRTPATIPTGSICDRHFKAIWRRNEMEMANDGDNSSAITAALASGLHSDVTLTDRTLYRDGDWNTLCLPFPVNNFADTPLEGATVKTLESSAFDNGTLTLNFSDDLTSIEAGKPYIVKYAPVIIRSVADWNTFASNVNNGRDSYHGKIVKLAADITGVSTMAGTSSHPFKGIFDGCGHTLNVSISGTNQGMAPFHYISDATIVDLVTAGTVSAGEGADYSGGIAGFAANSTIKNCRSSVVVKKNTHKVVTHLGGLVGSATGTLTISDCLFDGQMVDAIRTGVYHGGFVGDGTASITNCLFAPTSVTVRTEEGGTFSQGGGTFTNCYYTQTLGTAQGINASGKTGDELLTALGDGWEISGDKVVPKMEVNLDIHNPVFIDFPVSDATANVETQYVDFVGNSSPVDIAGEDRHILFLGSDNTLYYPNAAMQIGSCRAHFQLKGITADDNSAGVRAFVLNFGENETTGIKYLPTDSKDTDAATWYSLDGLRLSGKPTQRGIYVNNGRKIIIK